MSGINNSVYVCMFGESSGIEQLLSKADTLWKYCDIFYDMANKLVNQRQYQFCMKTEIFIHRIIPWRGLSIDNISEIRLEYDIITNAICINNVYDKSIAIKIDA